MNGELTSGALLTDDGNTAQERAAATRTVASVAVDAAECARLLDMLGLDAAGAR